MQSILVIPNWFIHLLIILYLLYLVVSLFAAYQKSLMNKAVKSFNEMSEKLSKQKLIEYIDCECGHKCSVEYSHINDDGVYTCANCVIEELIKRSLK